MRFILAALLILAPLSAHAQFKSYFDISALRIAALAEPDWSRKQEGDRVRYLCTNFARCPLPTAIEIKGMVRAETLPEAFETARSRPHGSGTTARTTPSAPIRGSCWPNRSRSKAARACRWKLPPKFRRNFDGFFRDPCRSGAASIVVHMPA